MEICFLGTGAPYPDPLRGSSAILVDTGPAKILLDCGRACVQQMARLQIETSSITHCFLTHGHYDHVADYALLVLTFGVSGADIHCKSTDRPARRRCPTLCFRRLIRLILQRARI